jgi:hypothetical protein
VYKNGVKYAGAANQAFASTGVGSTKTYTVNVQ